MSISKPPPLLGQVPPLTAPLIQIQNLPAPFRIADAKIKNEIGRCDSYSKRESQIDAGCFVEPWRASENPGRYDTADVKCGRADHDRRCAAIMWLYVVRVPRDKAGSRGITTYDLKI